MSGGLGGIAQGRTNPARDAAREAKRRRRTDSDSVETSRSVDEKISRALRHAARLVRESKAQR